MDDHKQSITNDIRSGISIISRFHLEKELVEMTVGTRLGISDWRLVINAMEFEATKKLIS